MSYSPILEWDVGVYALLMPLSPLIKGNADYVPVRFDQEIKAEFTLRYGVLSEINARFPRSAEFAIGQDPDIEDPYHL